MDGGAWVDRLREIARELEQRGAEISLEVAPPLPEDDLVRFERYLAGVTSRADFRFDPTLRALSAATEWVRFRWLRPATDEVPPIFGSIDLLPILALYESDPGEGPEEPWHGVFRPLDLQGVGTTTMIRFDEDGAPALALRVVEGGEETLTPLDLSIAEYLELALAACGRAAWPLLFARDRSVLSREHVADLLGELERIAPPADVGALERRRG